MQISETAGWIFSVLSSVELSIDLLCNVIGIYPFDPNGLVSENIPLDGFFSEVLWNFRDLSCATSWYFDHSPYMSFPMGQIMGLWEAATVSDLWAHLSPRPTVANSCTNQCEWHRLRMEAIFSLKIWDSYRVYLYAEPEWFDAMIICESMRIRHELIRCSEMQ